MSLGSGFATHNLRSRSDGPWAAAWVDWLVKAVTKNSGEDQHKLLLNWASAPNAKQAHPREEHLIPLHVAAGAGGGKTADLILDKLCGSFSFASFKWN